MRLRGNLILGKSAKLKLVGRKYKTDTFFRKSVDKLIYWRKLIDPSHVFTADELLELSNKRGKK